MQIADDICPCEVNTKTSEYKDIFGHMTPFPTLCRPSSNTLADVEMYKSAGKSFPSVTYACYPLSKHFDYYINHKEFFGKSNIDIFASEKHRNRKYFEDMIIRISDTKSVLTDKFTHNEFVTQDGQPVQNATKENYLAIDASKQEFVFEEPLNDKYIEYCQLDEMNLERIHCPNIDNSTLQCHVGKDKLKEITIGKLCIIRLLNQEETPYLLPRITSRQQAYELTLRGPFKIDKDIEFSVVRTLLLDHIDAKGDLILTSKRDDTLYTSIQTTYVDGQKDIIIQGDSVTMENTTAKGKLTIVTDDLSVYAGTKYNHTFYIDELTLNGGLQLKCTYCLIDELILPKNGELQLYDSATKKVIFVNKIISEDNKDTIVWTGGKGIKFVYRGKVQPSHKIILSNEKNATIYTKNDIPNLENIAWNELRIMG